MKDKESDMSNSEQSKLTKEVTSQVSSWKLEACDATGIETGQIKP